jgi:Trk K+ transport system NAD-binding subunit
MRRKKHTGDAFIADPQDASVLSAAILENMDMIISNDDHFPHFI